MTSKVNRDDAVARRVRALLNKTVENGATEDEAIAAAAKAGELMDKHRLSMSDLEVQAEPVDDIELDREMKVQMAPADYCGTGIARFCGIRLWFSMKDKRRRLRMLGLRHDVEMAQYLYKLIEGTMIDVVHREWARQTLNPGKEHAQYNRQAVASFRVGMASRINARLIEMATARDGAAKTGSGTALVVVKNAVVDAAFEKLGLHFRGGLSGMKAHDGAAYAAGAAAGDQVNLSRPLGGSAAPPQLRSGAAA